jgi:hypothetical protein
MRVILAMTSRTRSIDARTVCGCRTDRCLCRSRCRLLISLPDREVVADFRARGRSVVDGMFESIRISRERLRQPEPLLESVHGHPLVGWQLARDKLQCRSTRERPSVLRQVIEDERDQRWIPQGIRSIGAANCRCVGSGLARPLDEPERSHLTRHSLFEDRQLRRLYVANRLAAPVADDHVEHDSRRARAELWALGLRVLRGQRSDR